MKMKYDFWILVISFFWDTKNTKETRSTQRIENF